MNNLKVGQLVVYTCTNEPHEQIIAKVTEFDKDKPFLRVEVVRTIPIYIDWMSSNIYWAATKAEVSRWKPFKKITFEL
jgi:hypothetical protein